jgi:hypothetical protein
MYELEVQKYLRNGGSLGVLKERFGIKAKYSKEFPSLVLLKYSQIDSPMHEKIVQECRGLILNEADNWNIVAFPYTKFFNAGESLAATLDWNTVRVYEKLDGSLITLYYFGNKWNVSTSGVPDASCFVESYQFTFADLFWKGWKELGYQLPSETGMCFMFELMTPYNQVVVKHNKCRIVLHGVRDLTTGKEAEPEYWAAKFGWECAKSFPLNTFDDILVAANSLKASEQEGFVVRDAAFNRLKVKSPAYCALAHVRDSLSPKKLLAIIQMNEQNEFLAYFPQWTAAYQSIKDRFDKLLADILTVYKQIEHYEVQKDFALEAVKYPFSGALFAQRKGVSLREYIAKMNIDTLADWVQLNTLALDFGSMNTEGEVS